MGQQDRPWTDTATWDCQCPWQCPGGATSLSPAGSKGQRVPPVLNPWSHTMPRYRLSVPSLWSPQTQKAKKSSNAASLRAAQKDLLETPESALGEHWMPKQDCLLFLLTISVRKEINIYSGFFWSKSMNLAVLKQTLQVMSCGGKRTAPALVLIDLCQKLSGVFQIIFPSMDL